MMRALNDIIAPNGNALPLFHSPNTDAFYKIIESNELRAGKARNSISCIYFFYGKPSYSLRKDGQFRPFSLIVDANETHASFGMVDAFCFDSGGLLSGKYMPHFASTTDLAEVRLGNTPKCLDMGAIGLFGGIKNYIDGELGPLSDKLASNTTIASYRALVKSTANADLPTFDPPAHTFEVKFPTPILLTARILAVVAPTAELRKQQLLEYLDSEDIEAVPYGGDNLLCPLDSWRAMMEAVEDYYSEFEEASHD